MSGSFPSTPPLHSWKYRVTLLPLSLSCATQLSIRFWFAAKKTVGSGCLFSFPFFFWGLGPVAFPGLQPAPTTTGVLLLEAELCVCFHCLCWEWKMGGTLVHLRVGPLGCVRRRNCPLHTMLPTSIPVSQDIPSRWPWNSATAFQNTAFKSVSCHGRFRPKITKGGKSALKSWPLTSEFN